MTSPARPRMFLGRIGDDYLPVIREGLAWVEAGRRLRPGTRVLVKPNLTFPEFRPGVMTNPACLEALIVALKDYTDEITVGEADSGGYNRFAMSEVFDRIGLRELTARYGVRLVNFSDLPARNLKVRSGWRRLSVPVPAMLADEVDAFVSVPVPKVHANTVVSLSLKNLWGLIVTPDERLKLHPYFTRVLHEISKALPPAFAVVDGRYGLTRNGPLRGDAVPLGWLGVADSLYAADLVCTALMGVPLANVRYLRRILAAEGLDRLDQVELNTDYRAFRADTPFRLHRLWTDLPGYATFHSRGLAWLGYESPLAPFLHWALYRFREPFY